MSRPVQSRQPAHLAVNMAALRFAVGKAKDEEVMRLIAMLDAMRDQSDMDGVKAVLRPRLARLRPQRPVGFVRLLFLPLEPLIVPAGLWSVDRPTIPRTALRPLADSIRATIGETADTVEKMIRGLGSRDAAHVARAGALLWPAAADALGGPMPAGWPERTGLSEAEYGVLAYNVALVMAQVQRLRSMIAEVEVGLPIRPDALHAMLRAGRPIALAMTLTLILGCLPQALAVLAHHRGRNRELPAAVEAAKLTLLGRLEAKDVIEAAIMSANVSAAAAEARRTVMIVRMLREEPAPAPEPRVRRLQDRLDEVCLARFTAGLRQEFIEPLERLTPDADDAQIIRLEEAVRGLGEIAVAGSMIGGNRTYDILIQRMVDAVKTHALQGPLTRGDRARLVELLIGPAGAWRMLEAMSAG